MTNLKTVQAITSYYVGLTLRRMRQDERGTNTMEMVIIVAGILVVCLFAVGVIVALIRKYASKIS